MAKSITLSCYRDIFFPITFLVKFLLHILNTAILKNASLKKTMAGN